MKRKRSVLQLSGFAKNVAISSLDVSYEAHTGHVGSALSVSDMISVLYARHMRIDPQHVHAENRDRFILSKGHAAAALYSALFHSGIISRRTLETFGKDGGLCEHPEIGDKGVEMSTGSLGHGLAFGAGIALGLKMRALRGRVFVLVSDGECGEGSVWEGAMFAAKHKLDNLCVLIDYNGWQCFGKTKDVQQLEPFDQKWRTFGWEVKETDGHDLAVLDRTFSAVPFRINKPSVVIAHTVSGKRISLLENKLIGHYHMFSESEYKEARQQLIKNRF